MSDSSIGSLVNSLASNSVDPSIGIAVLKKALDSETATAAALLDALPAAPRLPSHLGNHINTTA
ncbi:MAG: YjfB family protein [Pseudomonadota bacterium]|nr:YjfB family protein [Pseudomonadota bacterium]